MRLRDFGRFALGFFNVKINVRAFHTRGPPTTDLFGALLETFLGTLLEILLEIRLEALLETLLGTPLGTLLNRPGDCLRDPPGTLWNV